MRRYKNGECVTPYNGHWHRAISDQEMPLILGQWFDWHRNMCW